MDLWDFLPVDLFMAETIQSEGDLDDVMVSILLYPKHAAYIALNDVT